MAQPNFQPIYIGKPRTAVGVLTAANVNRDGSGANQLDLWVADANFGSLIEKVFFVPIGAIGTASSDNVIRAWRKVSGVYRLAREFTIKGTTPTAALAGGSSSVIAPSAPAAGAIIAPDPGIVVNIRLGIGDTLAFTVHTVAGTQDNYHVHAEGGDFAAA